MVIQNANGKGLVIFQPTTTVNLNYTNDIASPFSGDGCVLCLSEAGSIKVRLVDDTDFRTLPFTAGWNLPQIAQIDRTEGDHASIICAAR